MLSQLVVREALEKAIQKELEAQQLYHNLGEKMVDEVAKDAFQGLAQEEKQHQAFLEKYQSGELKEGALKQEQVLDYKLAEHFNQPEIFPDMKLKDIFLLVANREKASHEFYQGLAIAHPPGEVRNLLEELASQELKHKHTIEFLYTEVAFPQTDGG
ncbi:ferritin family protein [Chloroflexota bacterium]